jgi:aminobenzoyl-glutamate utilization protein A
MGPDLVRWRRELHHFAETAWTEYRSSALIARTLGALGFEIRLGREILKPDARMGVPPDDVLETAYRRALDEGAPPELLKEMAGGFTGVVARLKGGRPGPVLGFRFDIDALDVNESQESAHLPAREGFSSCHAGAMHACGHDGHTTIGLGVASAIAGMRADWPGSVVLIFQPAEEGTRGARAMAEAGVADECSMLLCCHLGAQSWRTGHVIGGVSNFLATSKLDALFRGAESHAALEPERGRSALLGAATAVLNLHAIPRHSHGESRVNVGVLQAGTGRNVTPGRAAMKLEVRGANTEVVEYMERQARTILQAAATMHGLELEVSLAGASPSAASDPAVIERVRQAAALVPEVGAFDDSAVALASDDAAALMRRVQQRGGVASYVIVGANLASGHHTPTFDFDEAALPIGVKVLGLAALDLATRPPVPTAPGKS